MTTYFVSGFMRSGTSMMMKALEAGGLDAARNMNREKLVKQYSDEHYSPNKGGLYELERGEYQKWNFPTEYEGKLIKCLFGGITRIASLSGYKIVFMRRDVEEIRQSHQAFFTHNPRLSPKQIKQHLDLAVKTLRQRKDVDLVDLWYRDVVDEPLEHFTLLKERGWPIDPEKSAAIVDPDQCRFKLEELEADA